MRRGLAEAVALRASFLRVLGSNPLLGDEGADGAMPSPPEFLG